MVITKRVPSLTEAPSRTGDLVGLPLNGKLALIEALGRFRLPTQIRGHRSNEVDVILCLALGKHLRIDIAHIHQMLLGQQFVFGSLVMEIPNDLPVWGGSSGGQDLDNEMGRIGLTGLA
jgi:hypothetical protein